MSQQFDGDDPPIEGDGCNYSLGESQLQVPYDLLAAHYLPKVDVEPGCFAYDKTKSVYGTC